MAADITLDGTQYRARITVTGEDGRRTVWIHDGSFDVFVQLTLATARALAEQLLADKSSGGFATGGLDGGERMLPVSGGFIDLKLGATRFIVGQPPGRNFPCAETTLRSQHSRSPRV